MLHATLATSLFIFLEQPLKKGLFLSYMCCETTPPILFSAYGMQIKLSNLKVTLPHVPCDNCHMYLCEKVGLSEYCCKRIHSDLRFTQVHVRRCVCVLGILGKRLLLSQDNTCRTQLLHPPSQGQADYTPGPKATQKEWL